MKNIKLLKIAGITLAAQTLFGCQPFGYVLMLPKPQESQNTPSLNEIYDSVGDQGKSAELNLKYKLGLKYDDTFEIVSQEVDTSTGGMPFGKSHCIAEVSSSKYGGTFKASVDSDGNSLMDNYPKVVWGSEIEQKLSDAKDELTGISGLTCEMVYHMSDKNYVDDESITSYLNSGDAYVNAEVVLTKDLETAYNIVNDIRYAFKSNGLQYSLGCDFGDKYVVISEYGENNDKSDYEVYDKLERALS